MGGYGWHGTLFPKRRTMRGETTDVHERWWRRLRGAALRTAPRHVALDRSATPVSGDDCTGDVARARRGDEGDHFGDLLGARGAAEQAGGPERCRAFGERTVGVHRAGRDGVDPHATGAELR